MASVLAACRLYGILDLRYVKRSDVVRVAEQMIAGGVDIIQLRAKAHDAKAITEIAAELHPRLSRQKIPLVINDHPDVAAAVGAEGVHVGQDDVSIERVRAIAGPQCFVGKSTHSLEQAKRAQAEGADYIGFGPLFATPTKPEYVPIGLEEIAALHAEVTLPIFCIGGIKLENLRRVVLARAQRVVIVSGLLQAADVAEYARSAKALLHLKSQI